MIFNYSVFIFKLWCKTRKLNQEISCQLNIKFENVADLILCSTRFLCDVVHKKVSVNLYNTKRKEDWKSTET